MKKLVVVIWLLGLSCGIEAKDSWMEEAAGGFSAETFLLKDKISVPEPIILKATFHYPDNYLLDMTTLRKNLFYPSNPFLLNYKLIKEEISEPQPIEKGFVSQTLTYTLDPLVAGTIQLSLLNISFLPKEKNTNMPVVLYSGVLTAQVLNSPILTENDPSNIGFPAPLLGLKPGLPMALSLSNKERFVDNHEILAEEAARNERIIAQHSFPWGMLLAVIGLGLCYMCFRKLMAYLDLRRRLSAFIDPQAEALSTLSILQQTVQRGEESKFYLSLSEILRKYIQAAFHMNTYDETTEELLALVNQHSLYPKDMHQLLKEFFQTADLVKFARYHPSKEECEEAFNKVQRLILS